MAFRSAVVGGFRREDVLEFIAGQDKERKALEERIGEAEGRLELLQGENKAQAAAIEQMKAELEEQDELRTRLEQAEEEIDDLHARLAESQEIGMQSARDLNACEEDYRALQKKLDQTEAEKQELIAAREQLISEQAHCTHIEVEARLRADAIEREAEARAAEVYHQADDLLAAVRAVLAQAVTDSRVAAQEAVSRTRDAEQTVDSLMGVIDAQVSRMKGDLLSAVPGESEPGEEPAAPAAPEIAEAPDVPEAPAAPIAQEAPKAAEPAHPPMKAHPPVSPDAPIPAEVLPPPDVAAPAESAAELLAEIEAAVEQMREEPAKKPSVNGEARTRLADVLRGVRRREKER